VHKRQCQQQPIKEKVIYSMDKLFIVWKECKLTRYALRRTKYIIKKLLAR